MSKAVTVVKTQTKGTLYWHEYAVKASRQGRDITVMTYSTLDPFFDEEWGGFLMLMDSLNVKVNVKEESEIKRRD